MYKAHVSVCKYINKTNKNRLNNSLNKLILILSFQSKNDLLYLTNTVVKLI